MALRLFQSVASRLSLPRQYQATTAKAAAAAIRVAWPLARTRPIAASRTGTSTKLLMWSKPAKKPPTTKTAATESRSSSPWTFQSSVSGAAPRPRTRWSSDQAPEPRQNSAKHMPDRPMSRIWTRIAGEK